MEEILNDIKEEFKKLTLIPRKSGNEERVSKYLEERFKELGMCVVRDDANNVIAEKKVNDEDFIILQGHMDMVCTCEQGIDFDPLVDHIEMIEDDDTIHANKTTLGADDGIGLAIAIELAKNINKNIRIICTVDEECGMSGAIKLDSKYLFGKCLFNIDWEDAETICNSSAGGRGVRIHKNIQLEKIRDDRLIFQIVASNLLGGHSGSDIDKERTNAILALSNFLKELINQNIDFNILSFDGGFASNAIPSYAKVIFNIDSNSKEKIENMFNKYVSEIKEGEKIKLEVAKDCENNKNFTKEETTNLILLLTSLINGVNSFSNKYKDLVESSANIGLIKFENENINIDCLIRSCEDNKMEEIYDNYVSNSKKYGFNIEITSDNPAWPIKDNPLIEYCQKVFEEKNSKEIKVVQVHAGLECSYFAIKNKDLDMISVGPTIEGAHSPKEKVYISTIMPIYNMIKDVIEKYY